MTKVQIYLAAVALANDGIADAPLAFEQRLINKRVELALPNQDDQQFKNTANQQRSNLVQLKAQDDQIAAQAAAAAKAAVAKSTPSTPATPQK